MKFKILALSSDCTGYFAFTGWSMPKTGTGMVPEYDNDTAKGKLFKTREQAVREKKRLNRHHDNNVNLIVAPEDHDVELSLKPAEQV